MENFLTEIFAYCLKEDGLFCRRFLDVIRISIISEDFQVLSQVNYEGYGKPDVELNFGTTSILIECKIEAPERSNQLADYAAILTDIKIGCKARHIVFLTKYHTNKELRRNKEVKLHLVRWCDIFDLIDEKNKEITQQLKQFLKEQDMEKVKSFTIQDLLAIKTMSATISKMDELLELSKLEIDKGFKASCSRTTTFYDDCYVNHLGFSYRKNKYWLSVGFFWWWGTEVEVPHVGLYLEIPRKKFEESDLFSILGKELKGWEFEEDNNMAFYSSVKPISDFISLEEDNIVNMKKFIDSGLEKLHKVKTKYPKLFRISS